MPSEGFERKLAAILSADLQGYSRLMSEDEAATVRALLASRALIRQIVEEHHGRIVDSPGDNVLAEFASAIEAVKAAASIQELLREQNVNLPAVRRMLFRIGINVGDVLVEGDRIYGDGVNIAARLEGLSDAGGICISGSAHDQVKGKLSFAWEELGEQVLKNISEPVRAYRFLARDKQEPALTSANASAPLQLPECPSLVVLPFRNISDDPNQQYFADGITEDLIVDLSKISALFVIARHSAFSYKGKAVRVQEVARELGVRYILEGSVRRAGTRIRIATQLNDGINGRTFWAERYDRELQNLFELQDEITRRIVVELEVALTRGEQARVWRRATRDSTAYDFILKAYQHYFRLRRNDNLAARAMAQSALTHDPQAATAYVILGMTYMQEALAGWCEDDAEALQQAVEFANRAVVLNDGIPESHLILGWTQHLQGQCDAGIAVAERALEVSPNSADAMASIADLYNLAGRPAEAVILTQRAMRLSPIYPTYYLSVLGHAYRLSGRFEDAISVYQKYFEMDPDNQRAGPNLVIVYVQLGRHAKAKAQASEVRKRNPRFSIERWARSTHYKNAADLERDVDALRQAGLT